jgi:hypothetical protein
LGVRRSTLVIRPQLICFLNLKDSVGTTFGGVTRSTALARVGRPTFYTPIRGKGWDGRLGLRVVCTVRQVSNTWELWPLPVFDDLFVSVVRSSGMLEDGASL